MKTLLAFLFLFSQGLFSESYSEKRRDVLDKYREARVDLRKTSADNRKEYRNKVIKLHNKRNNDLRALKNERFGKKREILSERQERKQASLEKLDKNHEDLQSGKINKQEFRKKRREILKEVRTDKSEF